MTKREKASSWVVLGILILYLINSVLGFLIFIEIIPMNQVLFSNEYRESAGFSYSNIWWLFYILPIVFFSWVTTESIIRKWKRIVFAGSLLIIGYNVVNILVFILQLSANNYYELHTYFDFIFPMNLFLAILNIVGILLMVWNTKVSKVVKISITAYELMIYLLGYVSPYFQDIDLNLYFSVGMPLISIALLALYFYNGRGMKGISRDNE